MTYPAGVLAIVGATATGKSALAVAVAERLGGEVISADAFTPYRGFDVGTAKPSPEERRRVPHHLVDVKEPTEPFSAGEFAREARRIAVEILGRGNLPILCGGTGFYVRAFFDGLFEGPRRDEAIRGAFRAVAARRGAGFLAKALSVLDPESGARVSAADAARATRYLEILFLTGARPSRLFRERPGEKWDLPAVKILLSLPRPILRERMEQRFFGSIMNELPDEVRRLLASGIPTDAPAFAAIGYPETTDLLAGRLDRPAWAESILQATRRLAKRQETWFRGESDLLVLAANRPDLVDTVVAHARPLFRPSPFSFFSGGRPR